MFLALKVWCSIWVGHQIKLECDIEAVVAVLMHCRTRVPVLADYAHNIGMILVSYFDIDLFVIHVSSIDNTVADLLSRWDLNPT